MSRKVKAWLIAAAVMVLLGCAVFAGAMTAYEWDFAKLSTVEYVTNEYAVTEAFADISIETVDADVIFVRSADGKASVACYETEKCAHSVAVVDGTLTVQATDQRKWHDHIGIHFKSPSVTVALPAEAYGEILVKANTADVVLSKELKAESVEVNVTTGDVGIYCQVSHFVRIIGSTGDIRVENNSMKVMNLRTGTGKITVSGVQCQERLTAEITTGSIRMADVQCYGLVAKGTTGDAELENIDCDWLESVATTGDALLKNVVAKTEIDVERSTGSITLKNCDSKMLDIETSTGDVTGTILTRKNFYATSDTGKVDVPLGGVPNGTCAIVTETGDIKIEIAE